MVIIEYRSQQMSVWWQDKVPLQQWGMHPGSARFQLKVSGYPKVILVNEGAGEKEVVRR